MEARPSPFRVGIVTKNFKRLSRAETAPNEPAVGEVLSGRYQVVEKLARGTWCSVFRAFENDLGRFVALKVMHSDRLSDPVLVERFRREALTVSGLTHPAIITVFDFNQTEQGVFYIAMEYLDGHDLNIEINAGGAFAPSRALEIFTEVTACMVEVHAAGVLHRDLKPENIFLLRPGGDGDAERVKILDFGIAKTLRPFAGLPGSPERMLTTEGLVVGTPLYMSPEQLSDEPLTPASDVYALGHVLYEMLAGHPAYYDPDGDAMRIMVRHLEEPMPPLPHGLAGHPLAEIIANATRKTVGERTPSASALLAALTDPELIDRVARWKAAGVDATPLAGGLGLDEDALCAAYPARRDELRYLARQVDATWSQQRGRIVLLSGARGMDKGETVDAFALALSGLGDRISIHDRDRHPSVDLREGGLWADVSLWLDLAGDAEGDVGSSLLDFDVTGGEVKVLHELLAREREVFSIVGEIQGTDEAIYSAVSKLLVSKSRDHMLVWVLRDLQGADPSVLNYLTYLSTIIAEVRCRLVVVCTVNPAQIMPGTVLSRTLEPLLRAGPPRVYRWKMSAVATEVTADVLAQVLNASPSEALVHWVHEISGGRPALILDVVDYLRRGGGIAIEEGQGVLVRHGQAASPLLGEILRDRVARDTAGDRGSLEVLRSVALLGEAVPLALLQTYIDRLGDPQIGSVAGATEDLLSRRHLEMSFEVLRFVVPLTREVLLDDLIGLVRGGGVAATEARLKFRLAARCMLEHYEAPQGDLLDQIVASLVLGDEIIEAVRTLRAAGDRAYRSFELSSACESYERAHALLDEVPPMDRHRVREQLITLLRLGEIHTTSGLPLRARERLIEARAAADLTPDTKLAASVLARADQIEGDLALREGDYPEAATLFERAHRGFVAAGDDHGISKVVLERAHTMVLDGRPADALDPLLETLVLGEMLESPAIQSGALLYLAEARFRLGDLTKARAEANRALGLFEEIGNLSGLGGALFWLGAVDAVSLDCDSAREALTRATAALRRLDDRSQLNVTRRLMAWLDVYQRDVATAHGTLQLSLSKKRTPVVTEEALWSQLVWGDLLAAVGLDKESTTASTLGTLQSRAEGNYRELASTADTRNLALLHLRAHTHRAHLRARFGRFGRARALLETEFRHRHFERGDVVAELRVHELYYGIRLGTSTAAELSRHLAMCRREGYATAELLGRHFSFQLRLLVGDRVGARDDLLAGREAALLSGRVTAAFHLSVELEALEKDLGAQQPTVPRLPVPLPLVG